MTKEAEQSLKGIWSSDWAKWSDSHWNFIDAFGQLRASRTVLVNWSRTIHNTKAPSRESVQHDRPISAEQSRADQIRPGQSRAEGAGWNCKIQPKVAERPCLRSPDVFGVCVSSLGFYCQRGSAAGGCGIGMQLKIFHWLHAPRSQLGLQLGQARELGSYL